MDTFLGFLRLIKRYRFSDVTCILICGGLGLDTLGQEQTHFSHTAQINRPIDI